MLKCQATFFSYEIRTEKLEHLVTTGMMEGKCSREKIERMTDALKVTRGRDAWKVMIAYAKGQGIRLID